MAAARIRRFLLIAVSGIFVYNSFLLPDATLMPDIIDRIVFIQLAVVSPFIAITLWAMVKDLLPPEVCVTMSLLAIIASITLFLGMSTAKYSYLLIYTIPVCLAFGNVVLPLPFRMSVTFTGFSIAASSLAMILRPDWDNILNPFALMVNANCAIYMLIGTYRMERSERRAYLFTRREAMRAQALSASNGVLERLSKTDPLTGLANRRHFDATIALRCEAIANPAPLSLLMVDIDRFKALNDTFGHDAGDRALKRVAECLARHAPADATVARFGGEEFVILLPASDTPAARIVAEDLRVAVARIVDEVSRWELPRAITVSIGVASALSAETIVPAMMIKAADQALYRAKSNGRDRVECAADPVRSVAQAA